MSWLRTKWTMVTATVLAAGVFAVGQTANAAVMTFYSEGFEADSGGWGGAQTTAQAHTGNASDEQPNGSDGNSDNLQKNFGSTSGDLASLLGPNEEFASFIYTLWVYDGQPSGGAKYRLQWDFRDSGGSHISGSPGGSGFSGAGSGWTKFTVDLTSQANNPDAAYLNYVAINPVNGGNTPYFIDDALITYETRVVPEPATLALMGLGGLVMLKRRRRV